MCGRKSSSILCQVYPGRTLGYWHTRDPGETVNQDKKPQSHTEQSSRSSRWHHNRTEETFPGRA